MTRGTTTRILVVALALAGIVIGLTTIPERWFLKLLPAPRAESVVLAGSAASGTTIDCGGEWFNGGRLTELLIRSEKIGRAWDRPERITIRNCRIRGSIRIMGMGRNGEARDVRESSRTPGHTLRAQRAAPTEILISGVEIEAAHRIPLYIAPGTTRVTFENSKLTGWSCSTGIYLDAESADNVIRDNTFALRAGREVIAVDGSANNAIERNRFQRPRNGGIYLYRNCGEGGTIRHQTPRGNRIVANRFDTGGLRFRSYCIWLGSRNGRRTYCHHDAGFDFGSSADNRDFADANHLAGNAFEPPRTRAIRDDGRDNRIDPLVPGTSAPR